MKIYFIGKCIINYCIDNVIIGNCVVKSGEVRNYNIIGFYWLVGYDVIR